MSDFDPTRVPVGGTVRMKGIGMPAAKITKGGIKHRAHWVRDPGRHVDHTRTVDDPPDQRSTPHRNMNRLFAWERELLSITSEDYGAHRKPGLPN